MDPGIWNKVKEIFDIAIELPEADRKKFLDAECRENPVLYKEVISLLNSFERSGNFLDSGKIIYSPAYSPSEDPLINSRIGAYTITKWIALGGMGTVYMGERSDEHYRKKVAIKIINPGMAHDYVLKRFQNERQTLASLDHPNIARLLDGGTSDTGLPYFVMEYIEGEPIDKFCDNNRLSIYERLELFRIVCEAVHYAHQNLIVHRDIKPGNILVTKEGVPKLLDFGIAKIMDPGKTDYVYDGLTRTGTWHLTPEYASPEQVLGQTVTTSSDVYSLGVLLYKLLTGHHPYRIRTNLPDEINKIITDVLPEKPSSVIARTVEITLADGEKKIINADTVSMARDESIDKIRKGLLGDVDNIIQMAMRKEPQRRYSSVQQFSEDIRRHLKGLPVIARKDTFGYRSSKFIIRHKLGFSAVVLILLLFLGGGIAVLWQAGVANKERDKAQLEAKKSNEVKKIIIDMFSAADPSLSGKNVKVYDVLQEASQKIDKELKGQPALQAEILSTLGTTYQNLGFYDEAGKLMNRALELNRDIYSELSPQYASALKSLALLMHYKAEMSSADSLYRLAISIFRKGSQEDNIQLAEALNDYGTFLTDEGSFDRSEGLLREALHITEGVDKNLELYGSATNNLAITLDYKGNTEEAEKLYKEAYQFFSKKYGDFHPRVATAINNLAFISQQKKDYAEAERLFRKAYEMKLKIYGADHPDVGLAIHNWGAALYFIGRYNEAEKKLKEALLNYDKSFNKDHLWHSNTFHWLGKVYIARGELIKAESYLRNALALRKNLFSSPTHYSIAATGTELGYCLALQGKYSEAEKLLTSNYAILKESPGEKSEFTISAKEYLQKLNNMQGKNGKVVHGY